MKLSLETNLFESGVDPGTSKKQGRQSEQIKFIIAITWTSSSEQIKYIEEEDPTEKKTCLA